MIKTKLKRTKHFKKFFFLILEIILSDSPGLSDLSEDLNGGHRTSTPNMSNKRKLTGSAPELHFIKKQIGGKKYKSLTSFC